MTIEVKAPLVSIIVPNYNYARYLKERMDSIFCQTLTDYEVILLDDASTDGSQKILEDYVKDPRVASLTINDSNTGLPFLQWKKGIELARGRYIWIAESDDKCSPEFLDTCISELEKNPGAIIAFTGSHAIDETGEVIKTLDYDDWTDDRHKARLGMAIYFEGTRYATHNMIWKNYVYNASGTVFRKSAFDSDPDFDLCYSMRNIGDRLFWTVLMKKGGVIEIYQKLNLFRRHRDSQSAVGKERSDKTGFLYLEDMRVVKYILNAFRISAYRESVILGNYYKTLKRSLVDDDTKRSLITTAKKELGMTKKDYVTDRINKFFWNFIPGMISMRNDRL